MAGQVDAKAEVVALGLVLGGAVGNLVDRVFPEAPVRQWVLSLPIPLRYRLAYDHKRCSACGVPCWVSFCGLCSVRCSGVPERNSAWWAGGVGP